MRAIRPVIAGLLSSLALYGGYPALTLYQLQTAVRDGNATALSHLIDWPAVREGIKEDICDLVLDEPNDPAKNGQLPAFGASFVRGIAGASVDRAFTAEALATMAHPVEPGHDDAQIDWAFFSGPLRFNVHVSLAGVADPVKAELALTGWRWQVVRVWIPPALLIENRLRV
jgi:hypothetical protein